MIIHYWKSLSLFLLIIFLCLIPASELAKLDVRITLGDIIVHFIIFMAFSAVLVREIRQHNDAITPFPSRLIVLILGTLLGVTTELLQHWIIILNRTGSWLDLLFDFLGTLSGILLLSFTKQK